ncbi:FMN-binding negative transcriptional regulator [Brasilonema bromeliae SPC951]|uniref:FMN-binding negative transcriptional regulator n=1 Tax=Brasilonema bromeliae SPC951 TaxID=385972 RepID=A0ABX1PF60_9CYAN|nr:FMN-binding negative transcriptional regulator [Brasilonema bromeliae]NMG22568.1 FMN-binding negative transcriptional regulator [Brasilonema bromeliae SPC951]
MHPNPTFRWQDEAAVRAFVRARSFAQLFATTPDGPAVAHLPVTLADDDTLRFHLARSNRLASHLAGATGLIVVNGPDGYISPDWYGLGPDEVPTWNYLAVEIVGQIELVDHAAMMDQIDRLGQEHERALAPKPEWRRDKADPGKIDRMASAIRGFRLIPSAWRATAKLNQNKPEAARLAAADAVAARGQHDLAQWMRDPPARP